RNSNMGAPPNFSKTDLRKVKLDFAMMDEWVLKFAHLEGASLQGTYLRKAVLEGANLSNVNLTDATLDGANLKNADLRAANLVGTSLQDSDIEGADLTTAVGLAPEMVKKAKNYDKAKLPPGLLPVVGGRNP
ncbi:MAG TPA: pentapeptide repeat-containing protein, partial [Pyrinomonadaceae bacterium]|nr:pentapeptide repeat-containing protein [Pyrinomonadaceae bacterium]